MDEKQLQILWNSFAKENGGFTDYNEYKSLMSNSGARKVFFDSYNKDMGFTDYNEFESILGSGGASEVSTTGSVDTSQTSGQPLGSSAEPSLVEFPKGKEQEFQQWYKTISEHKGLNPNPDDPQHLYDYRAFYEREPELAQQLLTDDPEAHFTDVGKLPGHPTFSNESIYFNESNRNLAGRWDGEIYIPFDESKPVVNMETGQEMPSYPRDDSKEPFSTGPNELVVGGGDTTVASVPERIEMLPVEETPALSAAESVKNSISNVITQLEGFDEDIRLVAGQGLRSLLGDNIANEFASFTAIYNPGLNKALFGGAATAEASVIDAAGELERLNEEMGATKGIIETIRSGDLPGFGAAVVDALSSLASTAAVSVPTAGAGLFVDMGAQAISDYNKAKAEKMGVSTQELYASNEADFVVPFAIGSLGAGLEKIGFKGATQAILSKVSTPIMRKLAQIGIGSNKEGATEWIQHGLEAVNEAMGAGETDPLKLAEVLSNALISEEGAEAYLKGFAATSSAAGLSQVAQKMTSSARRGEVEQAAESISSIQQDLANPDLSPASRAVLEGQMDSALSRVAEVISEDAAAEANMTPEQYRQVASNMARLEDLQAVINDPAVSDATKESFVAEMDSISSEIDAIIAESETAQEQTQEMTEEAVSEGVEATEITEEVQESTNTPEEFTPQDRSVSEVEQEYETLSLDLAEERISPEQYNERAEELYREILSLRESEAAASEMEDRLFKENQERRRVEIDAAIAEFQSNNPEVTVDLFDDLPDAVVRTFDRVEAGLPTDPVALEEASSWLYDKYQSILAERDNPNRRHTTEQINAIAEQIGDDIALLENYKFNQNEAAQQELQSEGEADTVSGEAQGTETQQVEEGGQDAVQERETTEVSVVSEARDSAQVDETVREQARAEEEGQIQEIADEAQQDTVTEDKQSEVRAKEVEESGEGEAANMPPTERTNPTLKRLIRALPNQDVTRLMGPANVEARRDVIEAVTGTRPTKKDAGISNVRSTLDEYFGLEGADAARVDALRNWANAERTEFSSPQEAVRYQAENTDNPDDILRLYDQEPAMDESTDYKSAQISEYIGDSKINLQDYNRYGDTNNLTKDLARKRIDPNNKGLSLDVAAQELSESAGVEITPDDIVEFVTSYPTSASFQESAKSETQQLLEDRYRELTGRRITPNALERFRAREAASVTDADLIARDPGMQEFGVTPEQVADRQQMEASEGLSTPEAPLPKSLLKGVSDRLKSTGLANSVKIANTEQITSDYGLQGENINGFIDGDGNIVINSDKATVDTPIHEFAHAWEQVVEKDNPTLHARGMELIQTPEGNPYVEHVRQTQPGLEGNALYKEALAQAIGDSGARLVEGQQRSVIKEWLKAVWDFIATRAGISQMTPQQVANMTLREFTDAVATDLLQGKPLNSTPNGDVVMESKAKNKSSMNTSEKKIADFMERMRKKNNIKFQAEIPEDSDRMSSDDLVSFIEAAIEMAKTGMVDSYTALKNAVAPVGVTNEGDIRVAWASARDFVGEGNSTRGFRKAKISKDYVKADYNGMSDSEFHEAGRRLVEEGIVDPLQTVRDIIDSPYAPQPYEIAALRYTVNELNNRIDDNYAQLKADPSNTDLRIEADALASLLQDYDTAIDLSGKEQSQAFRLRGKDMDEGYNMIDAYNEASQYGEVSDEMRERLEALGKELNETKALLRVRLKELEAAREAASQAGINEAPTIVKPRVSRTPRQMRQDAIEVLDAIDLSSFGNPSLSFQANNTIRFSMSTDKSLSDALNSAMAEMKRKVSDGTRLEVALEEAIESVNNAVGKGKWNDVGFRSAVVNGYAARGHITKPSKPYVGSDGRPVIPSAYLNDIVTAFRDNNPGTDMTIDQMVAEAKSELGQSFDDRQIRDSISGYGRATTANVTDARKNIATAKTIGQLQSRLDDLEKLGYLPNSRQAKARQVNEEIADLRKTIQEMIESLVDSPEYKAQMQAAKDAKKSYTDKYIKDVEERIKTYREATNKRERIPDGYFSKKPKFDFTSDPDVIALERSREDIRNKLKEEVFRHKRQTRSTKEIVYDALEESIFNTSRMLSAGADISSYGVQGLFITLSDPTMTTKALISSIGKAGSTELHDQYFADLQRKPLYEYARAAKLNLQLPSFYQSIQEEQFGGANPAVKFYEYLVDKTFSNKETAQKWKDRFPYTAAERQYAIFLSDIRFNIFEKTVNDAINHFGLDIKSDAGKEKLAQIAAGVNDITMASNIKHLEGNTRLQRALNNVFFSLRKLAAGWKVMAKLPYYGAASVLNKAAKLTGNTSLKNSTDMEAFLFNKIYGKYAGRALGTAAAITIIPTLIANALYSPDDDDEPPLLYNPNVLNPVSSDFMKLKVGNTRIDLTGGIGGNTILLSRILTGTYQTSSSPRKKSLNESYSKYGGVLALDYFINKLAPTPSILYNKFLGNRWQQAESSDRVVESIYPMWISSGIEQYEDTGNIGSTIAFTALGMLGLAANTYGGVEFADRQGTNNKEAKRVFMKAGLADTTPERRDKNMAGPAGLVKVQDSDFLEKYRSSYNNMMTSLAVSKKKVLNSPKTSPAALEGELNSMRAKANKYAEIESTDVYMDANFRKTKDRGGNEAVLTNEQVKMKADMIKKLSSSGRYRSRMSELIRGKKREMRKEGLTPDDKLAEMEARIDLYNMIHSDVRDDISAMIKRGKLAPIPAKEYNEDVDEEGGYQQP